MHECPQCQNLICRRSRVSCPIKGRDRVLTMRCGSCAVVLTRRYLFCFLGLAFVFVLCQLFRGGLFDSALQQLAKGTATCPISLHDFLCVKYVPRSFLCVLFVSACFRLCLFLAIPLYTFAQFIFCNAAAGQRSLCTSTSYFCLAHRFACVCL